MLEVALVTNRLAGCSSTSTRDLNGLVAESTLAGMALGFAEMAARQELLARLFAVRHCVLARLPRLIKQLLELSLAARALQHHVRRVRTMRRQLILRMTRLGAFV
jgi:hypothetical protein